MATIVRGDSAIDPYSRLGLAPEASMADVKRAYRQLAMDVHPDHAGPASLQTFLAVKAAYEWIVAHPSFRSVFQRATGRPPASAARRTAPPLSTVPRGASAPPSSRGTWPGGWWYWEGIRARAARD
jgi:curved DNA-binding protein CbpA